MKIKRRFSEELVFYFNSFRRKLSQRFHWVNALHTKNNPLTRRVYN